MHGALEKYTGEGYYVNMDVASLYPSLMIEYDLTFAVVQPGEIPGYSRLAVAV